MATEYKKISQLPAAESLRGTDQLEIEREGTSKSIAASLIKNYTNDGLIDDAHSGSQSTYSSGLIDQKLDLKQNATDNRLDTVSKTIVGAINEIFSGGGGGYPVLYGTTDPTSAQGSDGQLYAKYETVNNVTSVIAMWLKIQSDWCSIVMSSGGDVGVECTQAQYDAWEQAGTLHEDTNYYITDGQSGGGVVIDDTTASTTTVYSSDKVEDLLSDKQDATDNSLTTTDKTVVGAINELKGDIAPSALRTSLVLDNFCVYSAERILANSSKTIPLTQNLFILFFKSYSSSGCYGAYLISYHPSVASSNYISTLASGNTYIPTLSIIDGNKLKIDTSTIDVYYSMLRLN